MNKTVKRLLPFAVILFFVLISVVIMKSKPEVQTEPVKVTPKQVRVLAVEQNPIRIYIKTQGNVVPRTETALVSQVAGQILEISPVFASGGFFEKGEVLVHIDKSDYILAVTQIQLQVAQAELNLRLEEQEAEVAKREWQRLNQGDPPPLVAREPQLKQARASLDAAEASLKQAHLNLERTKIKSPYTGRIRSKLADIGQYVNPGMTVANIYAVDYAEVRLPIPDAELSLIDFPIDFRGMQNRTNGPKVTLRADFAGKEREWNGYLIRIEGEVDSRSRMIYAVARVEDPYGKTKTSDKPPLTVGMFVHAEIEGKLLDNIVVLPRSAVRNDNQILLVDKENRLWFHGIEVLRFEADLAYISSGLEPGDRICISNLDAVVDGMPVEVFGESTSSEILEQSGVGQ